MRSFALAVLWVVASLGAVSVAWAGVSVVDTEVIAPAPATIAPFVGDAASLDGSSSAQSTPDADASLPAVEGSPTSTTATTSSPPPTTSISSADLNGSTDGVESTTSTTTPPAPTTTVPSGSTSTVPGSTTTTVPSTTTTQPPPTAETLTFSLVGGTTAISFSSSGVEVLWATPNPGFDVSIEPESPGWKVEFRSDTHRSRIDVWWDGGPATDIEERED